MFIISIEKKIKIIHILFYHLEITTFNSLHLKALSFMHDVLNNIWIIPHIWFFLPDFFHLEILHHYTILGESDF